MQVIIYSSKGVRIKNCFRGKHNRLSCLLTKGVLGQPSPNLGESPPERDRKYQFQLMGDRPRLSRNAGTSVQHETLGAHGPLPNSKVIQFINTRRLTLS